MVLDILNWISDFAAWQNFCMSFSLKPQPPIWRTRVSLFVWVITVDVSGTGGPTSTYATTSIALRIIWPTPISVLGIPVVCCPGALHITAALFCFLLWHYTLEQSSHTGLWFWISQQPAHKLACVSGAAWLYKLIPCSKPFACSPTASDFVLKVVACISE